MIKVKLAQSEGSLLMHIKNEFKLELNEHSLF